MHMYSYTTRYDAIRSIVRTGRDLFYGIEAEMEPRRASQSALLSALGPEREEMFCKADGSLDAGVELVTIPLRLVEVRAIDWRGLFAPILPIAMAGARTDRCGMHVHINRKALSPLTLARLLLMVNAPEMRDLMSGIAQRDASGFARFIRKTWREGARPDSNYENGGRYQAVNITRHTVEIRMFRGTIRYDRLLKNVEACDSFVHYCRETSVRHATDPAEFGRYVTSNAKRWPYLYSFMQEAGLS